AAEVSSEASHLPGIIELWGFFAPQTPLRMTWFFKLIESRTSLSKTKKSLRLCFFAFFALRVFEFLNY
ncbi:MAG: hypothetical protein KA773_24410, partial [Chloroflexi bacterium]|nr:hypothetical protein [Chloroflexota bacterium]